MSAMPLSSSERFLGRVEAYAKYRPSYPAAAIDLLEARCGLRRGADAVDLGSGTGILSALLVKRGARVFGIEPNQEMRYFSDLAIRGEFYSDSGTAEHTQMPDRFFDLMVSGQAFHWFDPQRTRVEALRILKPGAWAALLWNERPKGLLPFLEDYEALLRRYAKEYDEVARLRAQEEGGRVFFGHAPMPDRPEHAPLMAGLRDVFDCHQRDGKVVFPYQTLVYFGQPGRSQ